MKKLYFVTSLLVTLLVPFLLIGRPKNMGHEQYSGKMGQMERMNGMMGMGFGFNWLRNQKLLDELNLTEKQMEKIYKIRTDTEKEMITIGAELRKSEIDLREESFADKIDEAKIKSLIKKINSLRGKIFEQVTLSKLKVWKVLKPNQRKTIKSYMLFNRNMKHRRWK